MKNTSLFFCLIVLACAFNAFLNFTICGELSQVTRDNGADLADCRQDSDSITSEPTRGKELWDMPDAMTERKHSSASGHFIFSDHVPLNKPIQHELVKQHAYQCPVSCVDVFVYEKIKKEYCFVKRKYLPAPAEFWLVGGKIRKNESFFEAAKRTCLKALKLKVRPIKIIGNYSLVFFSKALNAHMHTVNTVILATCEQPYVDLSFARKWTPITQPPSNLYLAVIYEEALKLIYKLGEQPGMSTRSSTKICTKERDLCFN